MLAKAKGKSSSPKRRNVKQKHKSSKQKSESASGQSLEGFGRYSKVREKNKWAICPLVEHDCDQLFCPDVEYIMGDLPIVFSVPHGGRRGRSKYFCLKSREPVEGAVFALDTITIEIAKSIYNYFLKKCGRTPHFVICHLSRRKIDMNRSLEEALLGSDKSHEGYNRLERAWNDFHAFIDRAKRTILEDYGANGGLHIDLHGVGSGYATSHLGYLLTPAQIRSLAETFVPRKCTVTGLMTRVADKQLCYANEVICGKSSLGAFMERVGLPATPSDQNPDPDTGPDSKNKVSYWGGKFNIYRHGSQNGGYIDSIQIEIPGKDRKTRKIGNSYGLKLGKALHNFVSHHYSLEKVFKPFPEKVEVEESSETLATDVCTSYFGSQ